MPNDIGSVANELSKIQGQMLDLDGMFQQLGDSIVVSLSDALSSATTSFTEMLSSMQTDVGSLESIAVDLKDKMSGIWDTDGIFGFSDAISSVTNVVDAMKGKIDESGSSLIEYLGNIDAAAIGTWAQESATNALNSAEEGLNALLEDGAAKWLEDTTNMGLDTAEAWLQEEATSALNAVKETLNGAIDDTIGKLLEETGLFGESEAALQLQEEAVGMLNTAKETLNGLIDDTIGGLVNEGIEFAITTAKTWLQEAATAALTAAKKLLNSEMFISIANWIKETAGTVGDTVAKGAQEAITALVTAAQTALNFVMNMNPIALIVIAIAGLVAGFVLLWNKCEGFREFMTGFFKIIANAFIGFVNLLISGINMLMNIVLTPINLIIKALNIIPGVDIPQLSVSIPNIPKFAEGGIPGYGELFIAREAGPEFVGSFGSRNVVMNNNQIVEAVSGGVYDAVRRANAEQSQQPIYLNVEAKVRENVLFDMMETVRAERGVRLSTGGAW